MTILLPSCVKKCDKMPFQLTLAYHSLASIPYANEVILPCFMETPWKLCQESALTYTLYFWWFWQKPKVSIFALKMTILLHVVWKVGPNAISVDWKWAFWSEIQRLFSVSWKQIGWFCPVFWKYVEVVTWLYKMVMVKLKPITKLSQNFSLTILFVRHMILHVRWFWPFILGFSSLQWNFRKCFYILQYAWAMSSFGALNLSDAIV